MNFNKKKTVSVLFPLDDYLGQEGAGDEDLHQHGDDQLDDEEDNCGRTFLCDAAETVANGCLGLQGEEEGPCQSLHLHDAGRVVGWGLELCRGMFKEIHQFGYCMLAFIVLQQVHYLFLDSQKSESEKTVRNRKQPRQSSTCQPLLYFFFFFYDAVRTWQFDFYHE